mmetsp:Transcript_37775/g.55653  ORF Transcript_37775/g.55653 Transcript_37775/m.55653 type:complete len:295 (+) Transcript_37775:45-929(+)
MKSNNDEESEKIRAPSTKIYQNASPMDIEKEVVPNKKTGASTTGSDKYHWTPPGQTVLSNSIITKKTLFFIRHGIARHNIASHANQGFDPTDEYFFDSPLNWKGQKQAELTGDKIRKYISNVESNALDLVVVSPLTRCLQTATAAFPQRSSDQSTSPPLIFCHDGLREAYGIHTADRRRTRSELKEKWPMVHFDQNMTEKDEAWRSDKRETVDDVSRRAVAFFQWLAHRPETNIAIVSHGIWIECCLRHHCPSSLSGGRRVYNCDVFKGEFYHDETETTRKLQNTMLLTSGCIF